MNNDGIKIALINLRQSLNNADSVDEETLTLAQNLEIDIQKMLDAESQTEHLDNSMDLAMSLETRFESAHPVTAGCVREIINALHKMGV